MNLYDAAELRMSVKSFCQEELNKELLDDLDVYISNLVGYMPDIDYNVEIIKTYGRKMRAPYYAVLYSEEKEGCYINGGYVMEQIVLYLASRGIGTCYRMRPIGIDAKDVVGRKYIIAIAFGIAKDEIYRNPESAKRISIERLCVAKSTPTKDMRNILKVARLAPSSFNSQPWRFVITDNRIHIYKRESGTTLTDHISDVDVGVMLANMVVCAEELWVDITVKRIEELEEKKFARNVYVTSIKFEKYT